MYGAIARYGGRAALRYAPRIAATRVALRSRAAYAKYGAIGNELFHMAYRRGKRAYGRLRRRGGRRLLSRPSKRMRMSRRKRLVRFGDAPTSKVLTKRNQLTGTGALAAQNNKTLYADEISQFPVRDSTTSQNLYNRERDQINFVGVRVNQYIINTASTDLLVNFAIVCPKDEDTVIGTRFFRANVGNDRSADFTASAGLFAHYARINTDEYEVLAHKRYKLGPGVTNTSLKIAADKANYMHINKYFKINRRLTFDSAASTTPNNGRLFVVRWFNAPGDTAGSPVGAVAQEELIITNFFRDMQG